MDNYVNIDLNINYKQVIDKLNENIFGVGIFINLQNINICIGMIFFI